MDCSYSPPPLKKRGLRGIYLKKSPLTPSFSKGELNDYNGFAKPVLVTT